MIRIVMAIATLLIAGGCAIQRAEIAQTAQTKMVGMSKEQVLICMGPPMQKATEGQTEVWSYLSGNGQSTAFINDVGGGQAFASSSRKFCNIQIVMAEGRVNRVNYSGPTGALMTPGEQCAFAVQNCVK